MAVVTTLTQAKKLPWQTPGAPASESLGFRAFRMPRNGVLTQDVAVTLNSDDPAYFGGYVNRNFVECFATLPLDAGHAYRLARAGFAASFCDAPERAALVDEVDQFFARA